MKKIFKNKRVLQSRVREGVFFNDPDFAVNWFINKPDRTTVGTVTVTVDVTQPVITGQFQVSGNTDSFKQNFNSKSISKNLNINEDGNGPGSGNNIDLTPSFIYLSNYSISSITLSQSSNGVQSVGFSLYREFPLLNSLTLNIPTGPNWLFLESIPNIKTLNISVSIATPDNYPILKKSGLIALIYRGYNLQSSALIQNLPASLYYFSCSQLVNLTVNLADFFTGNRIGFSAATFNSVSKVIYSGGAIFPSVINEGVFKIDYILRVENNSTYNMMDPLDFTKFMMDFANQVTAVNTSTKVIRVRFMSPLTDYADNSQPKFKTYAAALAHITGTLGITVQLN